MCRVQTGRKGEIIGQRGDGRDGEEGGDVVVQRFLILLDTPEIIAPLAPNLLRQLPLGEHRIARDDTALHVNQREDGTGGDDLILLAIDHDFD